MIDPDTVYIVGGTMRTGTSMMMECLQAGGMEVFYDKERAQQMNEGWGDYVINDEYFELSRAEYRAKDFPKAYKGKTIKILNERLLTLPVGRYRVVFMRRNRAAIERSQITAFGQATQSVTKDNFDAGINIFLNALRDRRSFLSIDELWYEDVLADPLKAMQSLSFPINAELASHIPTRTKERIVV